LADQVFFSTIKLAISLIVGFGVAIALGALVARILAPSKQAQAAIAGLSALCFFMLFFYVVVKR
jgi:hypothetical protein